MERTVKTIRMTSTSDMTQGEPVRCSRDSSSLTKAPSKGSKSTYIALFWSVVNLQNEAQMLQARLSDLEEVR